jgi:hypothetical protein
MNPMPEIPLCKINLNHQWSGATTWEPEGCVEVVIVQTCENCGFIRVIAEPYKPAPNQTDPTTEKT